MRRQLCDLAGTTAVRLCMKSFALLFGGGRPFIACIQRGKIALNDVAKLLLSFCMHLHLIGAVAVATKQT